MPECVPNGYTSTDAWSLGTAARGTAADPPARNAAPDRARRGPIPGRLARHGCVRADGGIFACRCDEGRVRGMGRRARAPVVGRELECKRGVKGGVACSSWPLAIIGLHRTD
jgi:hypothetical protein